MSKLSEARADRRERLQLSRAELPGLLRLFLPLGGALLMVLEFRPQDRQAGPAPAHGPPLGRGGVLLPADDPARLPVRRSDRFKEGALAEFWWDNSPHVLAKNGRVERLTPKDLLGVWTSPTFGVIAFREVGDELQAVYRLTQGTVVGRVSPDGVFRGWWTSHASSRTPLPFAERAA